MAQEGTIMVAQRANSCWALGLVVAAFAAGGACSSEEHGEEPDGGSGSGGTSRAGASGSGTTSQAGRGRGPNPGGAGGSAGSTGVDGGMAGATGGAGSGGACDQTVVNGSIQLTLAQFCERETCVDTVAEAREQVTGPPSCELVGQYIRETTGCGFRTVSVDAETFSRGFVFDAADNLVGAYVSDDVIEPPCDTLGFVGGIQAPQCAEASTCRLCDNAAGAAGESAYCNTGEGGNGGGGNGSAGSN